MGGEAKLSRFEMKREEKKIAGSRTALDVGVGNVKKVKRVYFHSRQFEAINKHTTRLSFDKKKNKEKTVRVLACQPGLPNQPHQPTDTNQRTTHSHRLLWQHKAPANTLHRLPRNRFRFFFPGLLSLSIRRRHSQPLFAYGKDSQFTVYRKQCQQERHVQNGSSSSISVV